MKKMIKNLQILTILSVFQVVGAQQTLENTTNIPVSNFEASTRLIEDDKELIEFADSSTNNPTSWYWEFEGGTPSTSTKQYPLVRYVHTGRYSVKLTVRNEAGEDTRFADNYITVRIPEPLKADFSSDRTTVTDPNRPVYFSDETRTNTNITWYWEFEGGTPSYSSDPYPAVKYNKPGKYAVMLRVRNDNGRSTKMVHDYITVDIAENGLCSALSTHPEQRYITNVKFSGVDNASSYSDNGYEQYDFSNARLIIKNQEHSEPSRIEIKTNNVSVDTKVGFWVDWNQDKDFLDEGERTEIDSKLSKTWSAYIRIPENAKLGETILRVRTVYGDPLTSCREAYYGETEDYKVTVIRQENRTPNNSVSRKTTITPNPSTDGLFNFNFTTREREVTFTVYNSNGFEVYTTSKSNPSSSVNLDLSSLKSGIYTVKTNTESWSETTRIVIN